VADTNSTADAFDALPAGEAEALLHRCCSSWSWARAVTAGRPYRTNTALVNAATVQLAALSDNDIDDALAGHPRIGERSSSADSTREQSGVTGAAETVLAQLAALNAEYERRFGYVYLVFANSRPADVLLGILRDRLGNDPVTERATMREELAKITVSRLHRGLDELAQ
jgi:2-oxo-4-hydroxy-4-carboxy-5-ureidoimidazoline decarboxylase